MKRWHFPQRERGFPVAAMGEKDTSINSSIPGDGRKDKEMSGVSIITAQRLLNGEIWNESIYGPVLGQQEPPKFDTRTEQ